MTYFPASLERLIDSFASLPGIGRKSAQRLAFHVLSLPDQEALAFSDAIASAKKKSGAAKCAATIRTTRSVPSVQATGGTEV